MIVQPVNMIESLEVDEVLWVLLKEGGCQGRHYLLFNPHTFVGRIGVYCASCNRTTRISKAQIGETSKEARYWLRGYLAGCEPDAPRGADGDYLDSDAPEIERWRAAIKQFAKTGHWHSGPRACRACGADMLPSTLGLQCLSCGGAFEKQ